MNRFIPHLRAQLARRLPTPVNERERIALELNGFPEYESDLTSYQIEKIDELAKEIIRSNDTRDPIFEFRVEGHADVARRIANPAERRAQEQTISEQRAANGFNLLVKFLDRNGGHQIANKVTKGSEAFGLGATRLKVPNASTEPQFKMNRRVVFVVRQITFIPPPPEPPPPPLSVVEDRYSVRLIKGIVFIIAMPTAKPLPILVPASVTVTVTLEIKDHINKERAQFRVEATGVGYSGGPTPIGGSVTFNPGGEERFKTFRLLGARYRTSPELANFEGFVTVFMGDGAGVGPISRGGTLSFSFDALEANGINTNPTVISAPSGNSTLSAPGIDVGAVMPMSRMTMIGQPSSF